MGASRGFQANYDSLAAVQLNSRVVHGVHVPDTSIDFFGTKISMPVIAAPTGGTTYNMGGKLTEEEFVNAICGGCNKAGTLGAVADGIGDPLPVYEKRLQTLKEHGYKAIVGLKPRLQKDIIERMRLAEEAGIIALTIDLDSAGRAARATKGQTVEPKTFEQLKELVKASKLPLLFKGIMTPDEAELCINAGAAGIVVSNHGGRTLADTREQLLCFPASSTKSTDAASSWSTVPWPAEQTLKNTSLSVPTARWQDVTSSALHTVA